ncbi:MAG: hypothetical protein CMQ24_19690 [Gammaproteobacteria bacterium]|nr:hypothetical protein [Gammaproteobacteria bacterium]
MNRTVAVITAVAALPLLAFGALLVLVANPETFRDEIQSGFAAGTGWQLETGTMTWRYFPPISLELTNVSIDNNGTLAELQAASIDVALLPLVFGGNLELQGVSIKGLDLTLLQRADGTNNWTPATRGAAADPAPEAMDEGTPLRGPRTLRVRSVDLADIRVVYVDEVAASRTEATLLDFRASGIGYDSPFDLTFSGKLDRTDLSLRASGRATLHLAPGLSQIEIASLELEHDVRLPAVNDVDLRMTLSLVGALDLDSDRATVSRYALTVPGGRVEGSLEVRDLTDDAELTGDLSVTLSPHETMRALAMEHALPVAPGMLESLRLATDLQASAGSVQLSGIKGALDETTITGRAAAVSGEVPALSFELSMGELDLTGTGSEGQPSPANEAPAAAGPLQDSQLIPVDLLRSLQVDGRLNVARFRTDTLELDDLAIGIILKSARLTNTFAARAYGGSIDWQAKINARKTPMTQLDAHVVGVDLTQFPTAEWITGTLKLDTSLALEGALLSDLLASVDGTTRFDISDGTLDISPLKQAAGVVDSLRGKTSGVAEWPDTLAFTNLTGTHRFEDGAGADQRLDFALETIRGVGEGGFDLLADSVDYDLFVVMDNVEGNQLVVDDSFTGIRWPLSCRGPLSEPATLCRPDGAGLRRMVSDIAKQDIGRKAQDKLFEKLPDDVKDKARNLLKGLFR